MLFTVSCQIEEAPFSQVDDPYTGNPNQELPDSEYQNEPDKNSQDKQENDLKTDEEESDMELVGADRERVQDSNEVPDNEITDNEITDNEITDNDPVSVTDNEAPDSFVDEIETPDETDPVDEAVSVNDDDPNEGGDTDGITLVINEVDYENYGTAPESRQFIEIYNYGSSSIDLTDIKLYYSTIDSVTDDVVFQKVDLHEGSSVSTTDNMNGVIEAGGYILIHKGWDTATINKFTCQHRKVFTNILKSSDYGTGAVALVHVDGSEGTLIDSMSYNGCMNNVELPIGSFTSPEKLNGTFDLCETDGTVSDLNQNYLSLSRVTDGFDTNDNKVDFKLAKPSSPCSENIVVPDTPETLLNGDFQDTSFESSYDSARPNYHFNGWITSSYVEASNGGEYPYSDTSLLSLSYSGAYTRWFVKSYFRCGDTLPYEMTFKMKGSGSVLFELSNSKTDRSYTLNDTDGTFYYDPTADSKNLSSYTSFDRSIMSSIRVSFGDLSGFCLENDVITFSIWTLKDVPINVSIDNFSIR